MTQSAGGGSAGGGGGVAATPAADVRVVPQLGGLGATTLCSSNSTPVTVTIVPQTSGKSAKRSWVGIYEFIMLLFDYRSQHMMRGLLLHYLFIEEEGGDIFTVYGC